VIDRPASALNRLGSNLGFLTLATLALAALATIALLWVDSGGGEKVMYQGF
jgi:hypothetical protein